MLPKVSEKELVKSFRAFVCKNGLVKEEHCYFDGDNAERADIELRIKPERWPEGTPELLIIEAKSHHSTDDYNTVHKIFGQLLKEARQQHRHRANVPQCLAVLVPVDGASWLSNENKRVKRPGGIKFYREKFNRIQSDVFREFGRLVDARYVLAFSVIEQTLSVFEWNDFYVRRDPVLVQPGDLFRQELVAT